MIFVFSILKNIYFDVRIIAIIHLKSSTLRPSSVSCVGLMKIQPATKMFNLMFSNRISIKNHGRAGSWSPTLWSLFELFKWVIAMICTSKYMFSSMLNPNIMFKI